MPPGIARRNIRTNLLRCQVRDLRDCRHSLRIMSVCIFGQRANCHICNNHPMCGRYRLSRRKQFLDEHFDSVSGEEDWSPRYNIAPTQMVPILRQHSRAPIRKLSRVRWGLIPSWAKDSSGAASMVNARSETAIRKPAFRDALELRRCLIPADGFYEWKRTGNAEQPYCFEVNEGELFAFAGLWDRWNDAQDDEIETCSILTTRSKRIDGDHPRPNAGHSHLRRL
jgi:putative SOS response-associated peptidase YedK